MIGLPPDATRRRRRGPAPPTSSCCPRARATRRAWRPRSRRFERWQRTAVAGGTPILGICLGHQLLGAGRRRRDPAPGGRPPRRQSRGARGGHRSGRHRRPQPRGRGGRRAGAGGGGLPRQPSRPERRDRRGAHARRAAGSHRSSSIPRARRDRSMRRASSIWPLERGAGMSHAAQGSRHRLRTDPHRPGGRVRLRRRPGLPGAARGGRRDRARQLEPGHGDDRSGRRRHRDPRPAHARARRRG